MAHTECGPMQSALRPPAHARRAAGSRGRRSDTETARGRSPSREDGGVQVVHRTTLGRNAGVGSRPRVCWWAMSDVTHILSQIDAGDPQAAEQLLPLVYDELRK